MVTVVITLYGEDGSVVGERRMSPGDRSFIPSSAKGMVVERVEEDMGDFAL